MQHYAVFDDSGTPIAFYNDAVHGGRTIPTWSVETPEDIHEKPRMVWSTAPNPDCRIPAEATEITEQQWLEWIGAVEMQTTPAKK